MDVGHIRRRVFGMLLIVGPLFSTGVAENPIISHKYTADPSALVYKGRVYVYCSHDDNNAGGYDIVDYTLVSSDDMVNWTDHGEVFHAKKNTTWANLAYAPSCVERDGKFYLYFPDGGSSVGVAVADKPEGPFVDPLKKSLVNKQMPNCNVEWCFDPCAFIDDDGQAYLTFGGGSTGIGANLRMIKLGSDMISVEGTAVTINATNSFEASYLHKYGNNYYFSYSTNGAARIDYLMSDSPMSGYSHKGTVLPQPPKNPGTNNHASIIQYLDKWYIFYHDRRISNSTYFRSVSVDAVAYNADGTIKQTAITDNGPAQVKPLDPFDTVEAETMDREKGIRTAICSEGGIMLDSISNGDFTSLTGVDFGSGAAKMEVRAASASNGGTVEARLGGETGTLAGSCAIAATGGWTVWKSFDCDVSDCVGVQDVYFVYKGTGEPFRLNWFRFLPKATGAQGNRDRSWIARQERSAARKLSGLHAAEPSAGAMIDLAGRAINGRASKQPSADGTAAGMFIVKKNRNAAQQ